MNPHAQQIVIRYDRTADPSDHESDRLYRDLGFADDPLVAICHRIAGWAMASLGPAFWICLVYLLIVAEFDK